MWICSDWMFACIQMQRIILIFGSFFIHSSLSSSILPEGRAALAQSWTPGDLSGMIPQLGGGGNLSRSHLIQLELSRTRSQPRNCCCVTPALSCWQTPSSHKKRNIHLLLYREKPGQPDTAVCLLLP